MDYSLNTHDATAFYRRWGRPRMDVPRTFDPKYAALGAIAILLSVTVLVILPAVLKKQLSQLGKN
jgi:hypothetical protein